MRPSRRLSYPVLDLPTDQLVGIFRAIEKVLRNDATFSRACNTMLAWSGTQDDTKDPAWALCPYCRISPAPTSSDWATERQHHMPISIQVEMAVQGTDFDQLGNFWGAMRSAFFPTSIAAKNDIQDLLMGAGVTRPVIRLAAFGPTIDDENNFILIGRGSIEFNSLVTT